MNDSRDPFAELEQRVADIVKRGEAVRDRVAVAVADSIATAGRAADDLSAATRAAMRGTLSGNAAGDHSAIRDALAGLGDGLERAALATRLAADEAAREGRTRVVSDLRRVLHELGGLADGFVDVVGRAAADVGDTASSGAETMREHASRVADDFGPRVRRVAEAAGAEARSAADRTMPGGLDAVGEVFDAIGRALSSFGQRLREHPDDAGDRGDPGATGR